MPDESLEDWKKRRHATIKRNGKTAFETFKGHYTNPYSQGPDKDAKLAWDEGWMEVFREHVGSPGN